MHLIQKIGLEGYVLCHIRLTVQGVNLDDKIKIEHGEKPLSPSRFIGHHEPIFQLTVELPTPTDEATRQSFNTFLQSLLNKRQHIAIFGEEWWSNLPLSL